MYSLRDEFYSRIPENCKKECVRSIWQELWAKSMLTLNPEQMNVLGEAFVFAAEAHKNQLRKSGDPYIVHTLSAALILAGMHLDMATLEAALLHDTLEDTNTTSADLIEKFGADVENLVKGVTKLAGDDVKEFMSREDLTSENLRRMFIVMAQDIRVVLIKLADRLHNMRTLNVMKPEKRERIARETMEIYAPLAHRLGIYQIKRELEDLSFKYLQPDIYAEVERRVKKRMPKMGEVIDKARDILEKRLQKENIPCRIKGRSKHYYSIYEKMQRKKISFDDLYDILAVRVLVSDVSTCYAVLGIVHALWTPIPGQFDDYIANPKSNMYQSLHTTVMAFGVPLEVQIRTYEMNNFAEYGIAAHWVYKSGGGSKKLNKEMDTKLIWVSQALEAGQNGNSQEFMDILKSDILLTSELYVFTPDGKPMILPNGSTTLDFAYAVHTEIGNHCAGATINGRIVPLNTQLHNGDIVKILTSPQSSPSKDWLKIVSSAKTRSKIRAYFRQAEKIDRDEKLERGWKLIERELKRRGLTDVKREDFNNIDDQLVSVGSGAIGAGEAAQKLALAYVQRNSQTVQGVPINLIAEPEVHKKDNKSDILVEGEGGVSVTLASCCNPVPGDEIVGYASARRGITIHRVGCSSIVNKKDERKIQVSWAVQESVNSGRKTKFYTARLKAEGEDREDLLTDATKALALEGSSIAGIKATMVGNSLMRMKIELRVRNLEHLYSVMAKLNEVRGIMEVTRG
ncbi:MAG: bifunctional (p)ppGpp synthetase/guanosine-3',5'-bis(diphosphate) 3'-pyrophosphohydrolase [Synergistaceae bacterium]|nr:bifunctional (p)ppGpp synthetase/guanosine-3',5'-bis(diphosphate) 3'-pyrophosphohydrolase [Synergistaceae bacterium]MBR0080698.1 bifunctional (p)ppGpp synthetase/guanosine-3',5'-bis(diphosphate) 3'-pyrophosphohydrolase [Synergistaceae bacterium]